MGDDTAAVMIELVQGEGGVNALEQEFVDCIKALSEKHGFLMLGKVGQETLHQRAGGECSHLFFHRGRTPVQ